MHVTLDDPDRPWTEPGVYEVADSTYRIPLPLPSDGLRAVNVYALVDGDGLVLVDGGWAVPDARRDLESALAALGCGMRDVRRFLVTHHHRDHYTLAVEVRREFGTPIALGRGEQASLALGGDPRFDPKRAPREQLLLGGASALLALFDDVPEDHDHTHFEGPDVWLEPPLDVALEGRTLDAVATPGHTRGHVVFIDAPRDVLLAGDHVLPHITPSIGYEAAYAASPLADYLHSLMRVRALPDRRLLPAHGPAGGATHARIDELLAHHDRRLDQALAAVRAGGTTAYEVAQRLHWTRRNRSFSELDPFNRSLAVIETAAHLDLLSDQARVQRTQVDGVRRYALA